MLAVINPSILLALEQPDDAGAELEDERDLLA
jgi:hypothetical protein